METKEMKFDPMTGQPLNQNANLNESIQTVSTEQETIDVQPVDTVPVTPVVNSNISTQQQLQNIPTVEQDKQDFISNTQANSTAKEEEKKDGPNIAFIVIIFIIIFAAIFFLFPFLLKNLG